MARTNTAKCLYAVLTGRRTGSSCQGVTAVSYRKVTSGTAWVCAATVCVLIGRRAGSRQGVNGGSPVGKEGRGPAAAELNPELAYNKFKAGEGVLISHQAAQKQVRFG